MNEYWNVQITNRSIISAIKRIGRIASVDNIKRRRTHLIVFTDQEGANTIRELQYVDYITLPEIPHDITHEYDIRHQLATLARWLSDVEQPVDAVGDIRLYMPKDYMPLYWLASKSSLGYIVNGKDSKPVFFIQRSGMYVNDTCTNAINLKEWLLLRKMIVSIFGGVADVWNGVGYLTASFTPFGMPNKSIQQTYANYRNGSPEHKCDVFHKCEYRKLGKLATILPEYWA